MGDWQRYRKRPVEVLAAVWRPTEPLDEVRKYRPGLGDEGRLCRECSSLLGHHGMIQTLESVHIVCPGDVIIEGVRGELYPCKPDVFERTYEPTGEARGAAPHVPNDPDWA